MADSFRLQRPDGSTLKVRVDKNSIEITNEAGRSVLGRVTISTKEMDMIVSTQIAFQEKERKNNGQNI